MSSKEQRFLRRMPEELKAILRVLPSDCTIDDLESFGWNWRARIECGRRQFELVSSQGYIDVTELSKGKRRHVMPRENQAVTITPLQAGELVMRELAQSMPPDSTEADPRS